MVSLFRPAWDLLQQYADYHPDKRNIASHPVHVSGICVRLARSKWQAWGHTVTLAMGAACGGFKSLKQQVEQHAGPTLVRDLAHSATR